MAPSRLTPTCSTHFWRLSIDVFSVQPGVSFVLIEQSCGISLGACAINRRLQSRNSGRSYWCAPRGCCGSQSCSPSRTRYYHTPAIRSFVSAKRAHVKVQLVCCRIGLDSISVRPLSSACRTKYCFDHLWRQQWIWPMLALSLGMEVLIYALQNTSPTRFWRLERNLYFYMNLWRCGNVLFPAKLTDRIIHVSNPSTILCRKNASSTLCTHPSFLRQHAPWTSSSR